MPLGKQFKNKAIPLTAAFLITLSAGSLLGTVDAAADPIRCLGKGCNNNLPNNNPVDKPGFVFGADSTGRRLWNEYRAQNGLQPVKAAGPLAQAAIGYVQFLSNNNVEGHEADGRTPEARVRATGYAPCQFGENIVAIRSSTPLPADEVARRAMDWWKNSPPHDANLKMAAATDYGLNFMLSINDGLYVYKAVMLMGKGGC